MYKKVLKQFEYFFNNFGFTRKNEFFIRETEDYYQIVNIPRKKESTKDAIVFTIVLGVTSKKIMNYMNISSVESLMNNQWQATLGFITGNNEYASFIITQEIEIEEKIRMLDTVFVNTVMPAFDKISNDLNLIEDLLLEIKKLSRFSHTTIENLMILILSCCPDRVNEIIPILFDRAKNKNDELFLNELFRELGRKFKF